MNKKTGPELVEDAVADEPTPIKRGEPPVEAGATETGQITQTHAMQADLTGPELAEIKRRSEDVDRAVAAANSARDAAILASRMASYAQSDLTSFLMRLQQEHNLDRSLNYRIDVDRGQIIPVGPSQAPGR